MRVVLCLYWVALATATHWPRLNLGSFGPGSVVQLDKLVHVGAFGLLTWLLIGAKLLPGRKGQVAGLLIAVMYAILDEWTQGWVQRTVSGSDVLASLIGVGSSYLLAVARPGQAWGWTPIVYAARVLWLLTMPTLAVLTLLPEGSVRLMGLLRLFTTPTVGIDKSVHFYTAMILTWVLALSAVAGRARPRVGVALTLLIVAGSAPAIELIQRWLGRGNYIDIQDIYWHEAGVGVGIAGWCLARTLWAFVRRDVTDHPSADLGQGPRGSMTGRQGDEDSGGAFVGHAVRVSLLTLASRLTGLARDATLAGVFGLGGVADAFFLGFVVPNLFRRLFGEGALTAAFIPRYTRLLRDDPALARRFASVTVAGLAVLLAVLTLAGEGLLWRLSSMGGWSARSSLAMELTMWMLPYMPLVCLVALIGGALQVHGKFGPPAAAPMVLNAVIVAVAVAAAQVAHSEARIAVTLAWGVLGAGVLQLVWQIRVLWSCAPLTSSLGGTWRELRGMLLMTLPMVLGLAVFQINALLDTLIAFGLSPSPPGSPGAPGNSSSETFAFWGHAMRYPIETGSVAALAWAQRLYQFPLGVFGIAVATAIYPALARTAGHHDSSPSFRDILKRGLRLTLFIGLPASVGLILVRQPLVAVVYQRYAFGQADTIRVAWILLGYASSVWAYSLAQVLTRAFYAQGDTRTPVRVAVGMVGLNLCLNLTLIWPLGAAGLAWSTAISATLQVVILLKILHQREGELIDTAVWQSWFKTAGITVVMGVVLWPLTQGDMVADASLWQTAGVLLLWVGLGIVIVVGGAWALKMDEWRWLVGRDR